MQEYGKGVRKFVKIRVYGGDCASVKYGCCHECVQVLRPSGLMTSQRLITLNLTTCIPFCMLYSIAYRVMLVLDMD